MIWALCSLLVPLGSDVDPCFERPFPSYATQQECIEKEKAAFQRLHLTDPFEPPFRIVECRRIEGEPTS